MISICKLTFVKPCLLLPLPRLAAHDPPLALKNTGVLNRQSLAGALATGTHGTGVDFPIMSEQVRGWCPYACVRVRRRYEWIHLYQSTYRINPIPLPIQFGTTQMRAVELVTASGEVLRARKDDPDPALREVSTHVWAVRGWWYVGAFFFALVFDNPYLQVFEAAAIHLGALGVVTELELEVVDAFSVYKVRPSAMIAMHMTLSLPECRTSTALSPSNTTTKSHDQTADPPPAPGTRPRQLRNPRPRLRPPPGVVSKPKTDRSVHARFLPRSFINRLSMHDTNINRWVPYTDTVQLLESNRTARGVCPPPPAANPHGMGSSLVQDWLLRPLRPLLGRLQVGAWSGVTDPNLETSTCTINRRRQRA